MTTDDKIIEGKVQQNINREAAKKSVLSSGKIDIHIYIFIYIYICVCVCIYECLTGEEILRSD